MKKKVGVYYDYQNIYDASYDLEEYKNQIDFIEDYCSKLGKIVIKNLYLKKGKYKDEDKIVEAHQKEYSYEIKFGPYKKDIDTKMGSDFMDDSIKNIIDICVVISGDTDFVAPIEKVLNRKKSFKNYTEIERMGRFLAYPPLFSITHDPKFFPNARDISYVLTRIPAEALFEFFQLLVKECVDCGIIVPRILIWDGQFIRSNCNNNKKKG